MVFIQVAIFFGTLSLPRSTRTLPLGYLSSQRYPTELRRVIAALRKISPRREATRVVAFADFCTKRSFCVKYSSPKRDVTDTLEKRVF